MGQSRKLYRERQRQIDRNRQTDRHFFFLSLLSLRFSCYQIHPALQVKWFCFIFSIRSLMIHLLNLGTAGLLVAFDFLTSSKKFLMREICFIFFPSLALVSYRLKHGIRCDVFRASSSKGTSFDFTTKNRWRSVQLKNYLPELCWFDMQCILCVSVYILCFTFD